MRMVSAIGVFSGIILIPMPLPAVESQVYHIAMEGSAPYYTPELASVPVGYAIQWINQSATAHTITYDGCLTENQCAFDSGAVSPGNSFYLQSLQAGAYPYYCRLHPIMRGVVTVFEPPVNQEETKTIG